jgi:hypothetical protein
LEDKMTRNVTLKLDEEILKLCRYEAIEAGTSLSQWIADTVSEKVKMQKLYESMKAHALSILEEGVDLNGKPLSRDEAHGA